MKSKNDTPETRKFIEGTIRALQDNGNKVSASIKEISAMNKEITLSEQKQRKNVVK